MRGRRRNRATWFPILGVGDPESQITVDTRLYNTPGTAAYSPNVEAIPIIPDATALVDSTATGDFTLRDYVEGQTCIIERIVGKIVWSMASYDPGTDSTPNTAICCTAFAVLPVDATGIPALPSSDFDPFLANNSAQPWLWRRTWVLANNQAIAPGVIAQFNDPASNEFFASRDDGPHIDTKGTKRAIRREERLFQINATSAIITSSGTDLSAQLRCVSDLRVIGRMVKATNRSTFK